MSKAARAMELINKGLSSSIVAVRLGMTVQHVNQVVYLAKKASKNRVPEAPTESASNERAGA